MINIDPSKVSLIICYSINHSYLYHCLDIVERIGFKREHIWIDGYKSFCPELIGKVKKVTTHEQPHGERCYDLLTQSDTDYVIIVDSDFFCCDESFWMEVLNKLQDYIFVSVGKHWYFSLQMLTTPFVAYQRKEALALVPVREAWNHFAHVFPGIPDAVFDHLMYVFFTAMRLGQAVCIDSWENINNRRFKFCHLWDSRETYKENFDNYEKDVHNNKAVSLTYLTYGISKYIFHYVSTKDTEFDPKVLVYIEKIRAHNTRDWVYIMDTIKNLGHQISFKPDWLRKFNFIKYSSFAKYVEEFSL